MTQLGHARPTFSPSIVPAVAASRTRASRSGLAASRSRAGLDSYSTDQDNTSAEETGFERRLTAILAADVAGYSRLVEADEEGTLAQWRAIWRGDLEPNIQAHRGRVVRVAGDGILAEFTSVVDTLRCAVGLQRGMRARNADLPADKRIEFRVGVNFGELIIDRGDFWGDGVNIAARLEGLAEPGGICVSGRVQEDAQGKLDAAFDDLGEQQLKNIARPVRVYRVRFDVPTQRAETAHKPSIAVLPFQNLSADPEQEHFADGIVEEITTALSRVDRLGVIARNSSFAYKGRATDVKQVGRELGARFVLEGSVRKAANRVRVTAQLIDAASGHHVWAERYDYELTDVLAVQDDVAEQAVAAIEPRLVV